MTKQSRDIRYAEIRALPVEGQEEQEMLVEGRAIVYNTEALIFEYEGRDGTIIKLFETIAPGALDEADLTDVPFKYNHSDNVMVMARTRNKTLELIPDDEGLLIRAKLAPTSMARDLYALIQRGDIDKMSFAFTVPADGEEYTETYDSDTRTRVIKRKIAKFKRIWDVAAVDTPAYSDTSISARTKSFLEKAEAEAEAQREREAAEAVKLRKKLIARTYL